MTEPVSLCDTDNECVGCGDVKLYRGKEASSIVCCNACWKRLPRWLRQAFMMDHRRPPGKPEHGPTIWEERLSIFLQWMREADQL